LIGRGWRDVSEVPRGLRGKHLVKKTALLDATGEIFPRDCTDSPIAEDRIFPSAGFSGSGADLLGFGRRVEGAKRYADAIRTTVVVVCSRRHPS